LIGFIFGTTVFRGTYRGGGRAPASPTLFNTVLPAIPLTFALASSPPTLTESGLASFYDGVGRSGEMTCAHRTRAMGSIVAVTYRGRTVRCRVNDRGPFVKGRVIDLSVTAARALDMIDAGVVMVRLEGD
jgi:rare lipoprotein A